MGPTTEQIQQRLTRLERSDSEEKRADNAAGKAKFLPNQNRCPVNSLRADDG